ncbi:MAG: hypothetical protein KGO05_00370, partial [Chloroflexota bacterium]|nr:hypothetical protein [Chloroflexota bacterium]
MASAEWGRRMFDRYHLSKPFRYSRWDGTQRLDDLDAEGIIDALSEDYLRTGDLRFSLENMMRDGFQGTDGTWRMGLDQLRERLQFLRDRQMQRHNLASVMDDIKEKLEHIKDLERAGIQRRVDEQLGGARPDQQSGEPQGGAQGQDGQP